METDDRTAVAARAAELLNNRIKNPPWRPLPHQIPPPGDWYGWLLLAGRGAGKTDACAAYVAQHVNGPPCLHGDTPHWIGIIAPTLGDAVTACVTGPSGIKAHDPTARGPLNAPGGLVVRWPNGSQAKLFGANTPDDVERLRAGGNTCVAEGTLIRTERGLRPIETICVGDRVWTRNGLRVVLRTWNNGVKEVHRFDHASGVVWLTPDHEVWTSSGWKAATFVGPDDTVLTWGNAENRSSTTVFSGTFERMATTRTSTGDSCTGTCTPGKSGPSRMACMCITRTMTSQTTVSLISSCSRPRNTCSTTPGARTGTARADAPPGKEPNTAHSPVITADHNSSHAGQHKESASVQTGAVILHHGHETGGCAACAALTSNARPDVLPAPVRASALRSTPTHSVAKVYDLTVQHDHEFFAGDLLVSNCLIWSEELAAWRYLSAAWDQMRFGLRSGPRPHWVASTTPKPKALIKDLVAGKIKGVVRTHATMYDNPHLEQHIREALEETYRNTQLGDQELQGKLIDEDENALWNHGMIRNARVLPDAVPDLIRVTVGVDPSGGAGEQGIVVGGKSGLILSGDGARPQHHGFVLDDRSCHLSPDGWGRRAVQAAVDWEADDICVEINYGGAMAVATIRTAAEAMGIDIPVRQTTATRGKAVRAQPVSALTAQGRWHHAGVFEQLEDQLCTWYPEIGWSPDRLDAMVWTAWHNKLARITATGAGSLGGDLARKQIVGGRIR